MRITNQDDTPPHDTATPPHTGNANRTAAATLPSRDEHIDIFLYMRILLAYWWVILPFTILGAAAGYIYCLNSPKVYRAICRFEILSNVKSGTEADLLTYSYRRQFLGRHIVLLQSDQLNQQVMSALHPEWATRYPDRFEAPTLSVTPVVEASMAMLDISVDSFSPEYSLAYLRQLLVEYEKARYKEAVTVNKSTLESLEQEEQTYRDELRRVNDEIVAYETEKQLLLEEKRSESYQLLLAELITQRERTKVQSEMLRTQNQALLNLDVSDPAVFEEVMNLLVQSASLGTTPSSLGGTSSDPLRAGTADATAAPSIVIHNPTAASSGMTSAEFQQWRERESLVMRLDAEYKDQQKIFKPNHPKMVELQSRIEAAKRDLRISAALILKRLGSRLKALEMQEAALTAAIDKLRGDYKPSSDRAVYEQKLKEANRLKDQATQIFTRIADLRSSAVDKTITNTVERPHALGRPIWPVKWKIMSISTPIGTGLAVALVLLVYFLKSRLYDFEGLERTLGITCLAGVQKLTLKRFKKVGDASIVVTRDRDSVISETFRNLRTNIEHRLKEGDKIILLTSPDPFEGKTMLALNLATVFSWNRPRALIIDGDFRKSSMRRAFRDAPRTGLTDVLADPSIKIQDCIVKGPVADIAPTLDYLPSGHRKEDTAELLTLNRLPIVLNQLRELYDLIIIDSAPANRVVDTILLANLADAVVLVARSHKTTVPAMRYCYSRISSANIIGYVLNGIERSSHRYGYYSYGYYGHTGYYYHSYAYKSYYGSSSKETSEAAAEEKS